MTETAHKRHGAFRPIADPAMRQAISLLTVTLDVAACAIDVP